MLVKGVSCSSSFFFLFCYFFLSFYCPQDNVDKLNNFTIQRDDNFVTPLWVRLRWIPFNKEYCVLPDILSKLFIKDVMASIEDHLSSQAILEIVQQNKFPAELKIRRK